MPRVAKTCVAVRIPAVFVESGPVERDPAASVQPCRLTISLIQIGAKGEVQPFDTG
jgi:hypothetical protein